MRTDSSECKIIARRTLEGQSGANSRGPSDVTYAKSLSHAFATNRRNTRPAAASDGYTSVVGMPFCNGTWVIAFQPVRLVHFFSDAPFTWSSVQEMSRIPGRDLLKHLPSGGFLGCSASERGRRLDSLALLPASFLTWQRQAAVVLLLPVAVCHIIVPFSSLILDDKG